MDMFFFVVQIQKTQKLKIAHNFVKIHLINIIIGYVVSLGALNEITILKLCTEQNLTNYEQILIFSRRVLLNNEVA